jgi:hypothetical protein
MDFSIGVNNRMNIQDWQNLIGEDSNELCPDCEHKLFENKAGDKWCGECGWANSKDFMQYLRKDIGITGK